MKRRTRWIALAALALTGIALWIVFVPRRSTTPVYRFATVEKGDIEATISTTGELNAVTTVQVGTQVSGQISAIFVDFNDRVKKGQIIATIDPTLQQQAVREAVASLERNQAEMTKTERDYTRDKQLHDRQMLSDSDFNSSEYALAVARANLKSGGVALERARRNLSYTSIYAPIDGIVIERNMDVGQTVAASLSAPQIFLIANDLSQMQILASVDESDVGQIRKGQAVRFTVQSAPGEKFTGTVRQVRLQSAKVENVVTYTVVIGVENPGGTLLPGMTATVAFLVASAKDALLVPNAALRIRATDTMRAEAGLLTGERSARAGNGGNDSARAKASPMRSPAADSLLWYKGSDGKLKAASVHAGITNGQKTEVLAEGIAAGTEVLIGISSSGASATTTTASPFQQQSGQSGPGPPGGF